PISKGFRARHFSIALAIGVLIAVFARSALAANTEKDVVAGATDLGDPGAYNPSGLPTTTNDVTFLSATSYTNPTTLPVTASSISMGTLNDLNATALTISGGATGQTVTLNGNGNTISGTAADLIFLANNASMSIQNGTTPNTLAVVLASDGNFDVGSGGSLT